MVSVSDDEDVSGQSTGQSSESNSRQSSRLQPPPYILIYIEALTGQLYELRCSPLESVWSIKGRLARLEGIPISHQHIIWSGSELKDNVALHEVGIKNSSKLRLVTSMRGGPVNTRTFEDDVDSEGEVALVVLKDGEKVSLYRVLPNSNAAGNSEFIRSEHYSTNSNYSGGANGCQTGSHLNRVNQKCNSSQNPNVNNQYNSRSSRDNNNNGQGQKSRDQLLAARDRQQRMIENSNTSKKLEQIRSRLRQRKNNSNFVQLPPIQRTKNYKDPFPKLTSSTVPNTMSNYLKQYGLRKDGINETTLIAATGGMAPVAVTPVGMAPSATSILPPVGIGVTTNRLIVAPSAGKPNIIRVRCGKCGKRLGLAQQYECRCGIQFCARHRYAEEHDCTFDYQKDQRTKLRAANPSIEPPKLPKI